MNKNQTFEQFLATSSVQLPMGTFLVNFALAAILASALAFVYTRYGSALSNRKAFGRTFVLITMTTMLIITIVKSSLALSLGLVGALSIVRFRTAIKEPEELAYMFMCIAIGLGLGADQRPIIIIAFIAMMAFIVLRAYLVPKRDDSASLYLTVSSKSGSDLGLDDISQILRAHSVSLELKRFDENEDLKEVAYLIEFANFEQLSSAKKALQDKDKALQISILDNLGTLM